MITSTKGNLLESNAQALVNTVNTVGVMGKGIALQFKEAFPQNYCYYRDACKAGLVKVGQMFVTTENRIDVSKIIINFPTKTTWREPSEYSYIEMGLKSLRDEIIKLHIKSIAIPPLGSHNGGLDWVRVKQMIISSLEDVDCDIYLYEPSERIIERLKEERVKLTPARAMMLDLLCDMKTYGEFSSLFSAEKVVYFLQRFGAKDIFKVNYSRGYYGPYSNGKISHLLYTLNNSYIKGMGGMQVKPFDEIWILEDTPKTIEDYLSDEQYRQYKEIDNKTKNFLRGYYSNSSLELLATVDFLLQNDVNLKNWKKMDSEMLLYTLNQDITKWSKRKGRLYSGSKFLPKIIDHLKEIE